MFINSNALLGHYMRTMPIALWWLSGEVFVLRRGYPFMPPRRHVCLKTKLGAD